MGASLSPHPMDWEVSMSQAPFRDCCPPAEWIKLQFLGACTTPICHLFFFSMKCFWPGTVDDGTSTNSFPISDVLWRNRWHFTNFCELILCSSRPLFCQHSHAYFFTPTPPPFRTKHQGNKKKVGLCFLGTFRSSASTCLFALLFGGQRHSK